MGDTPFITADRGVSCLNPDFTCNPSQNGTALVRGCHSEWALGYLQLPSVSRRLREFLFLTRDLDLDLDLDLDPEARNCGVSMAS